MSEPCGSCGAAVRWATSTRTGSSMPFDVAPDAGGEWLLEHDRAVYSPSPAAGQLALLDEPDSRPRYRSHWDTCPSAAQHRGVAFEFERPTLDDDDA